MDEEEIVTPEGIREATEPIPIYDSIAPILAVSDAYVCRDNKKTLLGYKLYYGEFASDLVISESLNTKLQQARQEAFMKCVEDFRKIDANRGISKMVFPGLPSLVVRSGKLPITHRDPKDVIHIDSEIYLHSIITNGQAVIFRRKIPPIIMNLKSAGRDMGLIARGVKSKRSERLYKKKHSKNQIMQC